MSNATKPSAEALAAANHIWDATPAGDGTSFVQHWTPDSLARIIDSHFAELIDQSKDMASLLAQMLVLASANGRLTNDSMLADAIREQLKKYRSSRVIR